jgi:phosphoglycerate dehydrogenase-like enzyme
MPVDTGKSCFRPAPEQIDGVACDAGPAGLRALLSRTGILLCLLPFTDGTRGILVKPLFDMPSPHIASMTRPETAVDVMLDSIRRHREGGRWLISWTVAGDIRDYLGTIGKAIRMTPAGFRKPARSTI